MRRFSSYGPLDKELNYFAPREELLQQAYTRLIGDDPQKSGHYITVWAPRQSGKTSLMQDVVQKIKTETQF
jgi:predicted AAA+ superfamily ATPase